MTRHAAIQDEPTTTTRRGLMKLAAASAAVGGMIPAVMPDLALATTGAGDDAFWRRVRDAFPLDPGVLYMNVGTTGSTPEHVLRALEWNTRLVARDPRDTLGGHVLMRAAIAPHFGADPDEIVITNNTTDGMTMTFAGLVFEAGDEILTTNHEHGAGNAPMYVLRDRHGVVIRRVELPVGNDQTAQDYVDLFEAAINPRTKLIMFSAPTYLTGTMLPARRLIELAQSRGIHTLVDGAHATGMMNLNFHELGADFYAASGHKWQCGPGGTGVWYVRNKATPGNALPLAEFYPTRTSAYPQDGVADRSSEDFARFLQGHGNPNYPLYQALIDTCQFWSQIGRDRIEARILDLSAYTKERIAEVWGVETLYSPKDDPELMSGLTSFSPFEDPTDLEMSNAFFDRLREEYGMVIRNTNTPVIGSELNHRPLRISTHLFHTRDDVDRLIDAMQELSRAMMA